MSFINILLSLGWLSNNLVLNMHLIFLVASFILFEKPKWSMGEENNSALEKDCPV